MLLERMGKTVILEHQDGTTEYVEKVLWSDTDLSDQSVMDVQTRFINQYRYKGDSRTVTILWPKKAPHNLMDCHIHINGERFKVYGDPHPPSCTPKFNGYDMYVTATHALFLFDAELLKTERYKDEWGVWHTSDLIPTKVKVNLLRLYEDMSYEVRQHGNGGVVLLELPPETWDSEYIKFRFQGHLYNIVSNDKAGDVVVIGGVKEVTNE